MPVRVVPVDGLVFVLQHEEVLLADTYELTRLIRKASENRGGFLIVSEARGLAMPSARVRRAISESEKDLHAEHQGRVTAVLIDSVLLRGAVTSLSWFMNKVVLKPFESGEAALPFLREQADAEGVTLTRQDFAALTALDRLWNAGRSCLELSDPPFV